MNLLLAIVFSLAMMLDTSCLKAQDPTVIDTSFIFSKRKDVAVFWVSLEEGDSINLQLEIGENKKVKNIAFFQKVSPLDVFKNRLNYASDLMSQYDIALSAISRDGYLRYTEGKYCFDDIQKYRDQFNNYRAKVDSLIERFDHPLAKLKDSLTFLSDIVFSYPVSENTPDSVFEKKVYKEVLLLDTVFVALRGQDASFTEIDAKTRDSIVVDSILKKIEVKEKFRWKQEQEEIESWLHHTILLLANMNQHHFIEKATDILFSSEDTSFIDSIVVRKERLLEYLVEISSQLDPEQYKHELNNIPQKWYELIINEKNKDNLFPALNNNLLEIEGLLKLIKEVESISPQNRKAYMAKIKEFGLKTLKVKGGEIIAGKAIDLSEGLEVSKPDDATRQNDGQAIAKDILEGTILNSTSLLLNTGGRVSEPINRKVKNSGIYEIRIINKGWFKKKKKTGRLKITKFPQKDSIEFIKYDTIYTEKMVSKKYFHYIPQNDTQEIYLEPQLNYLDERTNPVKVSLSNKEAGYWGFWYGYSKSPGPMGKSFVNPLFSYVLDSTKFLLRDKSLDEVSVEYVPAFIHKTTNITRGSGQKTTESLAIKSMIQHRIKDRDKPFHDNYGYIKTPIKEIQSDSINFDMRLSTTNRASGRKIYVHTVFAKELVETRDEPHKVIDYLIPVIRKRLPKK